MTISELRAELARRVQNLQKQREELLEKLEAVERELEAVGLLGDEAAANGSPRPAPGSKAKGGRRRGTRRVNERPLREYLADALREQPRTLKEVSQAVLEAGYQTSSRKFSNNVNVVLHKDEQFEKKDGRWMLAEG